MSEKYLNKFRVSSTRLQHWDYANAAAYFITICTRDREHFFGEIVDGVMYLTDIGGIVEDEWIKTPAIRPDMNLELGVFVVMPNHFHAILIIGKNKYNMPGVTDGCCRCRDAMHGVSTDTPAAVEPYKNQFGPQSKNLSSIVRGFKSSVTTQVKKCHANFAWQARFHDHIIRDTESFIRIQNYIVNNPSNWKEDKFNGLKP